MKRYSRRIACGLIVFLLCGLFGGCTKQEEKVVIGGNGTGLPAVTEEEQEEQENPEVYIYKAVDESMNLMTFIKIGGGYREFTFTYSGATLICDRYGAVETVEEVKPGDVFELTLDEKTQKIKKMEESTEVWVYEGVENYTVDTKKDRIRIGQEDYRFEESVPVFDGEEQFTRKEISESDVLTVIGYKKSLLSVQITTAHGKLAFKNTEQFEDGYFVLGNVAAAKITEGVKLKVRAGEFVLKVAAKGRAGSKKITIRPGKTTTVDLKEFEGTSTKMCRLSFDLKQEGTSVSINGKEVDTEEGTSLAYGAYRIVASLDGYETWSRILFVNSEKAKITIDLTDVSGSSSGSSSDSTSGSSQNSTTSDKQTGTDGEGQDNTSSGRQDNTTSNTQSSTSTDSTGSTENDISLVNEVMDVLTGNED